MPKQFLKRPFASHGVSDIAVTQLQELCNLQGWAAEPVLKDYGEDLLVQTTSDDDEIEHFKLWFQVKGTDSLEKYKNADGSYTYSVSFAHIYKWLRSKELCVITLWDIKSKDGLYLIPRDEIDEWSFYTDRPASVSLTFDMANRLNASSIRALAWKSRIEHYFMLIATARLRLEADGSENARGAYFSTLLDFLLTIGVLVKDEEGYLSFSDEFAAGRHNGYENLKNDPQGNCDAELLDMASALAMIVVFERLSGTCGFPGALVEYCCEFIKTTTRLFEGNI